MHPQWLENWVPPQNSHPTPQYHRAWSKPLTQDFGRDFRCKLQEERLSWGKHSVVAAGSPRESREPVTLMQHSWKRPHSAVCISIHLLKVFFTFLCLTITVITPLHFIQLSGSQVWNCAVKTYFNPSRGLRYVTSALLGSTCMKQAHENLHSRHTAQKCHSFSGTTISQPRSLKWFLEVQQIHILEPLATLPTNPVSAAASPNTSVEMPRVFCMAEPHTVCWLDFSTTHNGMTWSWHHKGTWVGFCFYV